jgi:tRNA U34 5-methylaminomethyl-2-thiouridine-forming methyltransferase MnmC
LKLTKSTLQAPTPCHSWVDTEDNSQTLYSKTYDENCHSTSGALSETYFNYVEGCHICQRMEATSEEAFTILEVGLGLGLGVKATFEKLQSKAIGRPLHFISLEIDPMLVNLVQKETIIEAASFPGLNDLKKLQLDGDTIYQAQKGQNKLSILIGDARNTVQALSKITDSPINAIYQDAFSPKKNACLWTTEWFRQLAHLSSKDVILSTYSSSTRIRLALREAGFNVFSASGFAAKKHATRAALSSTLQNYQSLEDTLAVSQTTSLKDAELSDPNSDYFSPDFN